MQKSQPQGERNTMVAISFVYSYVLNNFSETNPVAGFQKLNKRCTVYVGVTNSIAVSE
jgi:hypothetical protein